LRIENYITLPKAQKQEKLYIKLHFLF